LKVIEKQQQNKSHDKQSLLNEELNKKRVYNKLLQRKKRQIIKENKEKYKILIRERRQLIKNLVSL